MSNDIQTGKMPGISPSSYRNSSVKGERTETGSGSTQKAGVDTVSVTSEASRLQDIESMLGNIPPVDNAKVAEIRQLIAEGKLDVDMERTAASLIEKETGVTDPSK